MLMPQGQIRKFRKIKPHGIASCGYEVAFGLYGLKSTEAMRLTSKQIEAVRKMMAKVSKKTGRVWIRSFPHFPVTEKPADVRMGGGKGNIEYYVANVKEGTIMFEVDGISEADARDLFQRVSYKLPMATKFVKRKFCKVEN